MPRRNIPTRLDALHQMLYRLDQLKDPDPRVRAQLEEEIRRCKNHSSENPSTNAPARGASTKKRDSQRQLTLE